MLDQDQANPMPEKRRDREIVLRVMRDRSIGNRELADATGLSDSYISRMISGQYPVHVDVLRWLHRETNDPELRRYLLGGDDHVIVPLPPAESDRVGVASLLVPLSRDIGELHTAATLAMHDRSANHAKRVHDATHQLLTIALRVNRAVSRQLEVTA